VTGLVGVSAVPTLTLVPSLWVWPVMAKNFAVE